VTPLCRAWPAAQNWWAARHVELHRKALKTVNKTCNDKGAADGGSRDRQARKT
jgi:hypothetical protein